MKLPWLIVFLALCPALWSADQRGVVRSHGQPIPGARVVALQGADERTTFTREDGTYVLPDLPDGTWKLTVEIFGFARGEQQWTAPGETLEWNLSLLPPPAATAPQPQLSNRARQRFQALDIAQTDQMAALEAMVAPADRAPNEQLTQNATESFLLNGSLSRGLDAPPIGEGFGGRGPGGFGPEGPGGFGPGDASSAGMQQPGSPFPSAGLGAAGGPGGPGGPGGFGGPGGPGGPGGGGPGRGPGPGGAGPRPEWMERRRAMMFGNRTGRVRDSLRGMANFTLGNSAFDARPYSITGQQADKPSYSQSGFGVALGGPLRIPKIVNDEKTFFFFNYRGMRSRNLFNEFGTVPTQIERAGDFSQSIAQGAVAVYDPATLELFPNNTVPASRIDSAAQGLLQFIPQPNLPGQVRNYQILTSVPRNSDNFGIRINRSLSSKDRLAFSYNLERRDANQIQLFGFDDTTQGRGQNTSLSWTRNVRPQLINALRLNFSRDRNEIVPFFAHQSNVAGELGITGTSQNPINYGPPNLSFTNFGDLTDSSPTLRRNQTLGLGEGITLIKGTHNWAFGGEVRWLQLNNLSEDNARGSFSFSGIATSAFDAAGFPLSNTGFDFADFLLGLPQSSSTRFGNPDTYFRSTVVNFYGQDDWRIRSNLSLNIGLRYEYQPPFKEKYGRLSNLDVAPGFTAVAAVTPGEAGPYSGVFPAALIEPDKNNIAPRIGVAWKPFTKRSFIVRGGYGWYYNGSVYNQAASQLAQQPPFATAVTLTSSVDNLLTIRNGFAAAPSTEITNTFAVARDYGVGYAQTWNLAVQHDLPASMVLEVGYLGTKGTRLDIQRSPNRAAPGSPLTAEDRRQIGNAIGFIYDSSEGNSIYHAAQVRLSRRFRRGLSANLGYTFAKSIDNVSTFGGGSAVVAQNDKNLSLERGLSSFDQRHALNLSWIWTSSFGGGFGPPPQYWWQHLLKNWTLGGGVTASSGTPLTATVLGNQANSGGSGVVGSGRADASGLPVDAATGFFNLAAFINPPADRFGNAGRNTIPGPGLWNMNLFVARSFRLDDNRRSLEFRVSSQNITNNVSFTRVGTTVNASNYGLATAAAPMRSIDLSVRLRF